MSSLKIVPISVSLIDFMGTDLSVVNAARVSFNKMSEFENANTKQLSEKDQKLLLYLAKHGHWSPFSHTCVSFRVKAPIFVARQLIKHQVGFSWNEVSRRYVNDEPEFYFPKVWRGKPENAKQGSSGIIDMTDGVTDHSVWFESLMFEVLEWYEIQIKRGMAPEQARMILPLNTMTEWIWTSNLVGFSRMCNERLSPNSQEETAEVAQIIDTHMGVLFPHSWKCLRQNASTN